MADDITKDKKAAPKYDPRFWLGSVIVVMLAFGLGVQYASYLRGVTAELPEAHEIAAAADFAEVRDEGQVVVLLEGAVTRRGYYVLDETVSLRELLEYARPTKEADISQLDLAHRPEHGDAYYIQSQGEEECAWLTNAFVSAETVLEEPLININTATAQELEALPGIGRVKAQAIIDYRVEHQGFRLKEELLGVKGIGAKIYEALADRIEV